MRPPRTSSIDEYLAQVASDDARASLAKIRAIIHDEVPGAEEGISYNMPGFSLNGPFIWFAAFKNHYSLFAGTTVADFAEELKSYKVSKGTVQFPNNEPVPESLVRSIVRARVTEHSPI